MTHTLSLSRVSGRLLVLHFLRRPIDSLVSFSTLTSDDGANSGAENGEGAARRREIPPIQRQMLAIEVENARIQNKERAALLHRQQQPLGAQAAVASTLPPVQSPQAAPLQAKPIKNEVVACEQAHTSIANDDDDDAEC